MFYFLICAELQVEVTLCVVVADAFHDLLQGLLIAGVLAILDPVADEVAHQAAEQFVAGVAQEATAVGQHADKVAQQPQASQGLHLLVHSVVGIAEPPSRAQLDLAGNFVILECTQDGAQHVKVGGVQAVQDHLRAFAGLGQLAQQAADGGAAIGHSDHIKAGIGAQLLVHLLVDIAQAAVMDLHGNVILFVQAAQLISR